jgi:hypothetical protein
MIVHALEELCNDCHTCSNIRGKANIVMDICDLTALDLLCKTPSKHGMTPP